ncbi:MULTISPECIES: tripartite tricarboxylate transporter permease [unclassified Marinobacter]|uniref:tripartite tricarboxylate transporter permease n=1 Tax=unclassified Marinobacter TaxID=83889 RepID=UPI00201071DE|nr:MULTISPECIES: tripartite tricarboxylate transporter permease [unclassified Marinobacter]MCL1478399.1 tripartite tricarboxylate transporter permease [Marinobacter sp.]MCL1480355.1 tripartite tricarboxylate transporter permease [Marinobacter sp.]MCL1483777.1 tripartite tricarboxylate transporter permease [Marinobacter sp.]MCL1487373.1 tripartite tricarboxylate transporter permease [Marinobacter sp.]UQG55435.1 tripartite tricarboxylate transporter permease [Marinobacter sp. M4C]
MDTILLGLNEVANLNVIMAIVIGALIGVTIGSIPGLEPAGVMAILLPITFSMEPLPGVSLLLGVYGGAWYGGAIPAILMNTPGTPVAVLTTYDGYPMAERGEARRALSIAFTSSFVGGLISVFSLIMLAPILSQVARKFGSAEFAMLAALGMIFVVLAHRKHVVEAAMMLGLGIFLGTIGLDLSYSTQVYTFGQSWLLSGMPLVPAVIGLFAMSQAFILLAQRGNDAKIVKLAEGGLFSGVADLLRHKVTVIRSAALGVFMGLLPGVGEFGSQFFSYTLAQKFSKTPEKFGEGAPEGLIASETSNNAVTASVMIPLLAFGIPADALMAMLLSVFMVHNYIPGPTLFAERPEFISGLYISLLLMNVVVFTYLTFATKWIVNLTRVRGRFIGAFILVLGFIGSYSQSYQFTDCLIALGFAIFGYVLKRNQIPAVPIVLGLVLGPLFLTRTQQALSMAGGDLTVFLQRPISLTLLVMIALSIGIYVWSQLRQRKQSFQ